MADVGPLNPMRHQKIAYPDVPSDCVSKLNELITTITNASSHLNGSAGHVQNFMQQANGIVQNVATISQGKATQALVPPTGEAQGNGYVITAYVVRQQELERHTIKVSRAGEIESQITVLEKQMPAVMGL